MKIFSWNVTYLEHKTRFSNWLSIFKYKEIAEYTQMQWKYFFLRKHEQITEPKKYVETNIKEIAFDTERNNSDKYGYFQQ